jgi:hypothetical protein
VPGDLGGVIIVLPYQVLAHLIRLNALRLTPLGPHGTFIFFMTGFKFIQSTVCEFEDDDKVRLVHYNDIIYASLTLFNAIIKGLRCGSLSLSFVSVVLNASKVIEETTMMRELMKGDEATYKRELVMWHLETESYNGASKMLYRIPKKADTFARFRDKKSCKVKDFAIEVVTKMYRIYQKDKLESAHKTEPHNGVPKLL